ncbi:sugar phosphate isomerase/epimerase family protein [Streptomyces turgidiscabies]|uniref:sugar phosphate isomerase/epimerase family protein n=1 Tax=Streptomyces TaxID=1883 RepID=UPI00076EEE82|nr:MULTISPECIES: sugar phosphate isomerase/epimerase family protein [Streptomyces]MDX3491278.1 sugar phosphate isomerase/epimerase [Streptomyces turgidiscabies]GAQ73131.1 L-ribulose-5-phosphate 3-epimerase UlaE [Streptomyces turgidiscabies]
MSPRPGAPSAAGARDRPHRDRARSEPPSDPTTIPAPLRFGYGTNGLTDLRLDDALGLLADLGYDGVGLTLDHMHLDPLAPDLAERTRRVARRLNALGLGVTVETGARYVLDPRRKHGPSLLDPDPDDRSRRVDLLLRAVRVAADLGAHAVHCFSGVNPADTHPDTAWHRLTEALTPVLEAATAADLPLAIEPEPGHLLATLADFHHLRHALDDPAALGLTLDIGHCQCLEPLPPEECVRAAAPWLRHVQIEDMRRGVHEHLPFGEGEIDFPPVLAALSATGYQGLTVVELPRHSHAGPHYAEHSLHHLRRAALSPSNPPADSPQSGPAQAAPASRSAPGPQPATPTRAAPAAPQTVHPPTAHTPVAAPVTLFAPPTRPSTARAEGSTP